MCFKMSAMGVRTVCDGDFTLPLTSGEALPLFTPEGERGWAGQGWDPIYAVQRADDDGSTPGTVFATESSGGDAIWIVIERSEQSIAYARVVPGRIAGTVRVACSPDPVGCRVRVTYDVTSLGPDGESWVREFENGFEEFLRHWRHAILASLSSG
jgi:hypothetical protein